MPTAQVIDLNPSPRTEYTPLEKTLSSFSKRNRENQIEQQDTDALREIYGEYQRDGQNIENALINLQTRSGLSPTARVNAAKQLTDFQKHNFELQKKAQVDMEKRQKLDANRQIIAEINDKRGLPEGSGEAYINKPQMYEQSTRPAKEKAAPGGLAGIPLSEEESENIASVIKANPNATAEELEIEFNRSKISPGRIKSILESRRRTQETEAKNAEEERKYTRRELVDFHKESQKYDEELQKSVKIAKNQEETFKVINQALKSGNVKPTSLANVFKGFGKIGDKISRAVLNEDTAALSASVPALLEGWKEVFGVRLSDADLKILEDKMPHMGNSLEANKAILKVMKKYSKAALLRSEIAQKIKSENKGLRPLNYANMVEQRYDEMTSPVRIVRPDNGKVIEIPAYQVGDAIDSGAKLADE